MRETTRIKRAIKARDEAFIAYAAAKGVAASVKPARVVWDGVGGWLVNDYRWRIQTQDLIDFYERETVKWEDKLRRVSEPVVKDGDK